MEYQTYRTALVITFACAAAVGFAQDNPSLENRSASGTVSRRITTRRPAHGAAASLRFDVNRVFIPVTVTDAKDHVVEGLHREDFRILEDGAPRDITDFFVDDSPVSVGIVLDSSNSMHNKFDDARRAIAEYLKMSDPEDDFFLISVQDEPELVQSVTKDAATIVREIEHIQPRGWTALYDGMYLGINRLRRAKHDRRVLLVLSDGGDNNSRYTESEIKHLVQESDVRIFTISILERSPTIEKLADQSGGRAFRARKLTDLAAKAIELSSFVHGEYVLGFTPGNEKRDGKHHSVKVELSRTLNGNRMFASWRRGYSSPIE